MTSSLQWVDGEFSDYAYEDADADPAAPGIPKTWTLTVTATGDATDIVDFVANGVTVNAVVPGTPDTTTVAQAIKTAINAEAGLGLTAAGAAAILTLTSAASDSQPNPNLDPTCTAHADPSGASTFAKTLVVAVWVALWGEGRVGSRQLLDD